MYDLPWPAVIDWGATPRQPVPASSWPFTELFIDSQRCACGGAWAWGQSELLTDRALERFPARCEGCGRDREFWFDASLFAGDPTSGLRFEELRRLFQAGIDRVESGDLDGARRHFEEVSAREPWFSLARYHLGMIAMVGDDLIEARRHLEIAAGITPMDPTVRMALFDLANLQDDDARAEREQLILEALRDLAGLETEDSPLDPLGGPTPEG